MRALALALAFALLFALAPAAPAAAGRSVPERDAAPILGTMPPYPGAARPLRAWEARRLAIASTADKTEAVLAYYIARMPEAGWTVANGTAAEALAAASAGQPAWLTFTRAGLGRLDLQVTQGPHPKTGAPVTLIFYQKSDVKP